MLQTLAKSKKIDWHQKELYCQCIRCKDTFSVSGSVRGSIVTSLDFHPHIRESNGSRGPKSYHCHCGGQLRVFRNF